MRVTISWTSDRTGATAGVTACVTSCATSVSCTAGRACGTTLRATVLRGSGVTAAVSTASASAAAISSVFTAKSNSSIVSAAPSGRATGRKLREIAPLTRTVFAPPSGAAAGGCGRLIVARVGARLKPMSINSVIRLLRAAVDEPPNIVAMTRS